MADRRTEAAQHGSGSTPGPKSLLFVVWGLLFVQAGLLAWGATRWSPCPDEVGHLAAGMSHWQLGAFELYRENPPLVRMVAVAPVLLCDRPTVSLYRAGWTVERPAIPIGLQFIAERGERAYWCFVLARWACIPFALLGGYICYRWARELYGTVPGILALVLWCFSPSILAHARLITPDTGAAALGLAAAYGFWNWLRSPSWTATIVAGTLLGLAELTKTIWIVLFPLWLVLWITSRWTRRDGLLLPMRVTEGCQMTVIFLLAVCLVNLGYGFEGSCQPLGDYQFVSRFLRGSDDAAPLNAQYRNRFADTWLAAIWVPLPKNYVMGIDRQRRDFEEKMPSYLRGEWRVGGWWYYYLYALAIKVPLGTWALILLALVVGFLDPRYVSSGRDERTLLAPLLVVLILVSSQTGFNHHLRYLLPVFPFAFIWASKVARAIDFRHWAIVALTTAALLWSVTSSLCVYPHSLSYFNELVGGPPGGHAHLGGVPWDSNIDWGQDLFYLKRWLDSHPEARPLGLAFNGCCDPTTAGIEYTLPPPGPDATVPGGSLPEELGPQPGWYAVSVNRIRSQTKEYAYFLHFRPVAMAGYSIYIYHITPEEANRVRRRLGLPGLPSTTANASCHNMVTKPAGILSPPLQPMASLETHPLPLPLCSPLLFCLSSNRSLRVLELAQT